MALTHATGSYATAGACLALFGAATALLAPPRGRLIDAHGARVVLVPMALCYGTLLSALAVLAWNTGAPRWALLVCSAAAGATAPPLGPTVRARWGSLIVEARLLRRAFALDTVSEEVLYILGPLVAGALAAVSRPSVGVLASAVFVVSGTLAMTCGLPREAKGQAQARQGQAHAQALSAPGGVSGRRRFEAWPALLVSLAVGLSLGGLSLLIVAFAQRDQHAYAAAWIEAVLSIGSAAGGLAFGALRWHAPGRRQLGVSACGIGLALTAAGCAPGLSALAVTVGVVGIFVAPTITMTYLVADEASHSTRAGASVNAAYDLGAALGPRQPACWSRRFRWRPASRSRRCRRWARGWPRAAIVTATHRPRPRSRGRRTQPS